MRFLECYKLPPERVKEEFRFLVAIMLKLSSTVVFSWPFQVILVTSGFINAKDRKNELVGDSL